MIVDYLKRLMAAPEAGPSVPDWIGAIAAVVTTMIAGGALWFAAAQIKEAKSARDVAQHEAKAARDLSQELEVERAQPYVVVFTEPSAATNLAIDLVVKNFGATAARDVRITVEPWPQRADPGVAPEDVGIPDFPILAPGQEWRTSWVWAPDREGTDLPDRHEGDVRYYGLGEEERSSPLVLDLSIYTTRRWVEVRTIHDAAQALRDIKSTVSKWTEGTAGLAVVTRSGEARDERLQTQAKDLRRRRQERADRQAAANAPAVDEAQEGSSDTPNEPS